MYFWLHRKECNHGDPWPCIQPKGYMSCGENGWTIGQKVGKSYYLIGSDCPQDAKEFDSIVPLYLDPCQRSMIEEVPK